LFVSYFVYVYTGICDGLGLGQSSKATLIREGTVEMQTLVRRLNPDMKVY